MTGQPRPVDHLGQVARGAALGLAGSAVAAAATFALAVAVTRGLTPEAAGRFFTLTSLFVLLYAAAAFGTEAGLARFLLRLEAEGDPEDLRRVVAWAAGPTIAVAFLGAAGLLAARGPLTAALGLGEDGPRLLGILAVALPAAVVAEVFLSMTRGLGHIGPTVVADRLVRSGWQCGLAVALLAAGGGLVVVTAAWASAYVMVAALALMAAVRCLRRRAPLVDERGPRKTRGTGGHIGRQFWKFTWPRGVGTLAQVGIQKADIVLIAILLTPADAALYAAATRFVPLGQMAVQALQQVLQPRFTSILITKERDTLAEVFRVTTSWSILIAWPLYLIVVCAPSTYLHFFGSRYEEALPVVVVLGSAMLVAVATGPVDTLLLMAGRSRLSMGNALFALAVDIGACLVLVPRWGISGAAVAWAVAVTLRCALATGQIWREFAIAPDRHALRAGALPLLCFAAPLLIASTTVGLDTLEWLLMVVVGAAVYVALLHRRRHEFSLDLLVPRRDRGSHAVGVPVPSTTSN